MTHGEKAELVAGLYRATIQILDAGIAARYPHASPRERFLRRAIVTLGRELTVAAYPEASAITD